MPAVRRESRGSREAAPREGRRGAPADEEGGASRWRAAPRLARERGNRTGDTHSTHARTHAHTHTQTHSHTPGLEHTLTWCLGYHSTTCTERHPGTSHSSADGRLGNLSACYRQRWQETWPLSGGTQNRPLGRVPWPSCREPRVLTLAERLWAAVLELRAQPAHTGAHRTATASVQ